MRKTKLLLGILCFGALLLGACTPQKEPVPDNVPATEVAQDEAPAATDAPEKVTEVPTQEDVLDVPETAEATEVPLPTATPVPTATPKPTATPVPTPEVSETDLCLSLLDETLGNPEWYASGECQYGYSGHYGVPKIFEPDFYERFEKINWNKNVSRSQCTSAVWDDYGCVSEQSYTYCVKKVEDGEYRYWSELDPEKVKTYDKDITGLKEKLANMNYRAFDGYEVSGSGENKTMFIHSTSTEVLKNLGLGFDEWINRLSGADVDLIPEFDTYVKFKFKNGTLESIHVNGYAEKLKDVDEFKDMHDMELNFYFKHMGEGLEVELPAGVFEE